MRVLMVDDNPRDAELVRDLLGEGSGPAAELDHVAGFEEALRTILESRHDAYLVDYRLGGRSGIDLIQEARDRGADGPFILVTGQGDPEVDRAASRAGASDFVTKDDLTPELLERTLRYAVERSRAYGRLAFQAELLEAVGEAVIATNREGAVIYWNRAAEELFGWDRDEAMGRPIMELTVPAEAAERGAGIMEEVIAGGSWSGTFPVRRKDGSTFQAHVTNTPLRSADGEVVGVIGVAEDVTERVRAEEALRAREERFRALIENATDTVTLLDPDGTIRYSSSAREEMLGESAAEHVGQNAFRLDAVHPEDLEVVEELIEEAKASPGETVTRRLRLLHDDGSWRTLETKARDLTGVESIRGIVINSRDITERLALERQLHHAQKLEAVGRLAGGVAHDFNNILTTLKGLAHLVLDELPEESPLHWDVEQMADAVDRGVSVTNRLLSFSRSQVLEMCTLELNELVEGLRPMLSRLLGEEVTLRADLGDGVWEVHADPGQLEHVIVNLVVNARDALDDGGTITIRTANRSVDEGAPPTAAGEVEPGDYAALAVEDDGKGIPAEMLSRIFEPFFTTKERGRGTGLGLSTVYGIVRQSGGAVDVKSEVGEGTRVTVLFPRTEAAEEESEAAGPEEAATAASAGPGEGAASAATGSGTAPAEEEREAIILVVEDEDEVRRVVRRVLERAGHRVHEASSAAGAVEMFADAAFAPDLLVTDVVMPETSGIALAEKVRKLRPGLPVIWMSGYTEDEVVRRGLSEQGERFLRKPFSPGELRSAVRNALHRPETEEREAG